MDDATQLPPIDADAAPRPTTASDPKQIGRYRVLEVIGDGGMGTVFKAEQRTPVTRIVALKLIKLGMDSTAVIARFNAERQALALMDHPNIAHVLDAGATDAGRPYFVMEYVPGESITSYCDRHRLTTRERLELFAPVCDAVQHAHQKGIIHRDLKPSNILITVREGKPLPKVIDFGVAKATAQKLTEKTLFIEAGQLIGTPEYMSPEQAEMTGLDVDTRSDIYSLGVVLYELLTGALPFDSKTLRTAGYTEIQRIIRDVDPPRPSTRLSTLDAPTAQHIAEHRQIAVDTLTRDLRRELECIPLKAMHKDRTRRYRTATELADDIANYLAQRPLVAAPDSAAYRLHKLLKRNKGPAFAAALIAIVLLAGITGTSIGLVGQSRQRAIAERQRVVAQKQTAEALRQRAAAESERASSLSNLALLLQDEGKLAEAEPLYREALSIRRRISPPNSPRIATLLNNLGLLLIHQGKLTEAEPPLREALKIRRAKFPPGHPIIATSLNNLALLLLDEKKLADAEPLFREALAINRHALPVGHPDIASNIDYLALLLADEHKFAEVESLYREALAIRRQDLPVGDPDIASDIDSLASLLADEHKFAEAESLYREALAIRRQDLPAAHPRIAVTLINLGTLMTDQHKFAVALPFFREALEIQRTYLPAGDPRIADTLNSLGSTLLFQGQFSQAEPPLREALDIRRKALPPADPRISESLGNLAGALHEQHKFTEAEQLFREALRIKRQNPSTSPSTLALSINDVAAVLMAEGKLPDAEPLLRESLAISNKQFGLHSARTKQNASYLAILLERLHRQAEATALRQQYGLPLHPATAPAASSTRP